MEANAFVMVLFAVEMEFQVSYERVLECPSNVLLNADN